MTVSTGSLGNNRTARSRRKAGGSGRWQLLSGLGLAAMAGAAAIGWLPVLGPIGHEHALADAWHRAVDADHSILQAFDRVDTAQGHLYPAANATAAKPLIIGERVTLVTPDGAIHTVRVCDPLSPSASSSVDCLNALVSRAVQPVVTPAPQRSL